MSTTLASSWGALREAATRAREHSADARWMHDDLRDIEDEAERHEMTRQEKRDYEALLGTYSAANNNMTTAFADLHKAQERWVDDFSATRGVSQQRAWVAAIHLTDRVMGKESSSLSEQIVTHIDRLEQSR